MSDQIQIMELFGPTIQGEGIMSGTVTHFLRTGGCGLRCTWCDSMFAVMPDEIKLHRRLMTTDAILKEVLALPGAPYITFTGGDPCIQPLLGGLIPVLNVNNIRVAVETQGQYFPDWLLSTDVITFSPKGPSSGNVVNIGDLGDWLVEHPPRRSFRVCIKIVIFTQEDYLYALHVYNTIPSHLYDAFYFTAGTPLLEQQEQDIELSEEDKAAIATARTMLVLKNQNLIAEAILNNNEQTVFNDKVHVGCQQHVLLWPNETKGV